MLSAYAHADFGTILEEPTPAKAAAPAKDPRGIDVTKLVRDMKFYTQGKAPAYQPLTPSVGPITFRALPNQAEVAPQFELPQAFTDGSSKFFAPDPIYFQARAWENALKDPGFFPVAATDGVVAEGAEVAF